MMTATGARESLTGERIQLVDLLVTTPRPTTSIAHRARGQRSSIRISGRRVGAEDLFGRKSSWVWRGQVEIKIDNVGRAITYTGADLRTPKWRPNICGARRYHHLYDKHGRQLASDWVCWAADRRIARLERSIDSTLTTTIGSPAAGSVDSRGGSPRVRNGDDAPLLQTSIPEYPL